MTSAPHIGEVVEVVLGALRKPTEAEIRELRAIWWRQRRLGHTLPAEAGLVVLDGGATRTVKAAAAGRTR